ncbi:MAG: hypothetical protein JW837_12620 [Sedimentisphaerales bacterium]|nr:hypothetical protein [Sedimentisphaerales bacterium]
MFEILQDFESTISGKIQLNPVILVGPGLVCIVAGLFLWLGGLGFKKILVAVTGSITGGIFGFLAIRQNIVSASFMAALTAALAILFERIFITILTALLAGMFAFVVLAGSYLEKSRYQTPVNSSKISNQNTASGVRESAKEMKIYIIEAGQKIKHACLQMPLYIWALIMVLMLICTVVGFSLWHLALALCCSALGTILIFTGMILLLLNKGSMPVSIISSRSSFYAIVFTAMMIFGTTEQLLLCKRPRTSPDVKSQANENKQKTGR